MVEYEYLVIDFPGVLPREDVRQALVEHAEYGRWELHRTRVYRGGRRRTWLRRRIIRAPRRPTTQPRPA